MYSGWPGMTASYVLLSDTARMPVKSHVGEDAGFDLFVSRETIIPPHEFMDVHLDIAIALPTGFFARIVGRSSTVRIWKLQIQEGVIDAGYRGKLFVGTWNLRNEHVTVPIGTRLAQIIPQKIEELHWASTDELPPSSRGVSGFGSTGT